MKRKKTEEDIWKSVFSLPRGLDFRRDEEEENTVGFFVLHDVLGRLAAVVVPLHVDRRAGHGHHSQVVGSVRRLLHVQLHQLLVPAVHVARLTHVRAAVFRLHVADFQRGDHFLAERLLSFREPEGRGNKK